MKLTISALALAGLIFTQAEAAPSPRPATYSVWGVGVSSCGNWTDTSPAANSTKFLMLSWLQGYLSAYNNYVDHGGNVAKGTDIPGIIAWMDNYCHAHPLDNVATASDALMQALKAEKASHP